MKLCIKCGSKSDVSLGQTSCFRCGAELPEESLPDEPKPLVNFEPPKTEKQPHMRFGWNQSQRIVVSLLVALGASGMAAYDTVQRNDVDYQVHPVASLIGSVIPGIIVGFIFYWWINWRSQRKSK
jgi:hypothetical protein